jgi:hypothetical protein
MKKFILLITIAFLLFAKTIVIDNFQTDIFSKQNNGLQKIKITKYSQISRNFK